jgi:hypothetical protein
LKTFLISINDPILLVAEVGREKTLKVFQVQIKKLAASHISVSIGEPLRIRGRSTDNRLPVTQGSGSGYPRFRFRLPMVPVTYGSGYLWFRLPMVPVTYGSGYLWFWLPNVPVPVTYGSVSHYLRFRFRLTMVPVPVNYGSGSG